MSASGVKADTAPPPQRPQSPCVPSQPTGLLLLDRHRATELGSMHHHHHHPFSCQPNTPHSSPEPCRLPLLADLPSHAPIISFHHAPEDAGWWSCPGHRKRCPPIRFNSVSAAQTKGLIAVSEQHLSQLPGLRFSVFLRNSRPDIPNLAGKCVLFYACGPGSARSPAGLSHL